MPNDPLALAMQPDSPSEDEYQAFLHALSETARGRAFLAEHARRSRTEDSAMLLSSVQRLEGLVRDQTELLPPPEPVGPNPFDEVRDLLETVRDKQDAFDLGALTAQIGMLADMIEGVHRRIDNLAMPAPVEAAPEEAALPLEEVAAPADELVVAEETAFAELEPEPVAAENVEAESVPEAMAEPETILEIEAMGEATAEAQSEPAPEPTFELAPEPEFIPEPDFPTVEAEAEPVPEPADETLLSPLEFTRADDVGVDTLEAATPHTELSEEVTSAIPEVAWGEGKVSASETPASVASAPAAGLAIAALIETLVVPEADEPPPEAKVIKAGTIPPPTPFAGEDFSSGKRARTALPSVDPLADIKALSDEERVALFT